jgi:nitronate monooxygenase
MSAIVDRAKAFCARFGLQVPIILAPMAGVKAPALSIAVIKAGGMGACGALVMPPDEIVAWAEQVRAASNGPFQLNLWIPDPPPKRDPAQEARVREFLAAWGPNVAADAGDAAPPSFSAQCDALLAAKPRVISSIMGVYAPDFVAELKRRGIAWFAAVTTVAEARLAEAASADVIVAQGMEAGGHRGCFEAAQAERRQVGLMALVPAVVDAVSVPVVAAGGIADARGVAAALALGASAVQIGTGFLRCPEADIPPAWANALRETAPEHTVISRVFSGRAARSIETDFVRAATAAGAPQAAPYPVQRGLTTPLRKAGLKAGDLHRMQPWAGQSAALATTQNTADFVRDLWRDVQALLR